jgi:hypothetical protein
MYINDFARARLDKQFAEKEIIINTVKDSDNEEYLTEKEIKEKGMIDMRKYIKYQTRIYGGVKNGNN